MEEGERYGSWIMGMILRTEGKSVRDERFCSSGLCRGSRWVSSSRRDVGQEVGRGGTRGTGRELEVQDVGEVEGNLIG